MSKWIFYRWFLLVLLAFSLPKVHAQSLSLDRPLNLTLPKTALSTALQRIEEETAWRFSYNPKELPTSLHVNVQNAQQSLRITLDDWLQNSGFTYKQIGGQVVIFREKDEPTQAVDIRKSQALYGFVREAGSQEPLPYAQVLIGETQRGAIANQYGYFVLNGNLPTALTVSHLGYDPLTIVLGKDALFPLELELERAELKMDSVEIETASLASANASGHVIMGPKFIARVPTFLGERDVVKALQYLPGVQRANEGNSSLYVRGGNGDQNLILLDEAPVYNVNHLFGFFSVFNGDAIQSMEFLKGGFPAHYGGRVSSVLSITTREGSRESWGAKGGIGITSSRLTVDGPILGKKGSLLISARRSYWDVFVRPFLDVTRSDSKPFFYFQDYHAKATFDLSKHDKLIGSFYHSRDRYGVFDTTDRPERYIANREGFDWGNLTGSLRWNRILSARAFMNTSVFLTNYQVTLFREVEEERDFTPQLRIEEKEEVSRGSGMFDLALKHDLYLYPSLQHRVRMGGILYQHNFTPNRLRIFRQANISFGGIKDIDTLSVQRISTQEAALYLEDQWQMTQRLQLEAGFRLSGYRAGKQSWIIPEPRFRTRIRVRERHQLEASVTHMAQYIHQVSNTGLSLPIDVWIPSTEQIAPQRGWQGAVGWQQTYPDMGLSILTEAYYKTLRNVVGYRQGATFNGIILEEEDLVISDWEDLVVQGDGIAYGLELMADWQKGPHQVKLSYAWSRTLYQFEALNRGEPFGPRQDRRHMLSLLYKWDINRRLSLHAGWFLATGNPIPLPISQTYLQGDQEIMEVPEAYAYYQFSELDQYRTPLYHRLDATLKIRSKDKPRRWKWAYYWEIGAFNVYNRLNPTFYELVEDQDLMTGKQTLIIIKNSLFFITPSVSFNLEF